LPTTLRGYQVRRSTRESLSYLTKREEEEKKKRRGRKKEEKKRDGREED